MSRMIEQPAEYFSQLLPRRSQLLEDLEREAQAEKIPIVGPVAGQLLYLLARLGNARRVLELGTAIGYSTIFLARACRQTGGHVTSVERNTDMAQRARQNLARAGLADLAEVECRDALEVLKHFTGSADMIFLDIEKADYAAAFAHCANVVRPGGLLVADNTGFKEADLFNRALQDDPAWATVNLWGLWPGHSPEYDGVCLAIRQ